MDSKHKFSRPDLEKEDSDASEAAMLVHFKKILKSKSTIFDVGANRGQFALEMLNIIPDLLIYSFEPVPAAFKDLKDISDKHPQIKPYQLAISSDSGSATFHVTESDVGSSFLEPLPNQPSKWLTPSHDITVSTVSLNDFMLKEKIQTIDLLKCDAQGFDLEVLKSAGEFFKPSFINAILVELNFRSFYSSQSNAGDIISEITKNGYRLAWMYPHRSHDEWLWWADALFLPEA